MRPKLKHALKWIGTAICLAALILFLMPLLFGILNIGNLTGILVFGLLTAAFLFSARASDWLKRIWRRRAGRCVLSLFSAAAALILTLTLVITGLMVRAASAAVPPDTPVTVLVLGCGVQGDRPSLMLTERLERAFQYLGEQDDAAVCILSGGQGSDEAISEADCMYQWLVRRGIDPQRLIREDRSTSTLENLAFSKAIIQQRGLSESVAIVTSEFHEYRAAEAARAVGLTPAAVPAGTRWWLLPTFYVRELYGVLHQWLCGHYLLRYNKYEATNVF